MNYILLPGYHSAENTNFYPWLINELKAQGSQTQIVSYNELIDNKTEQEVFDYINKQIRLDENTVLIGHSLGGVWALKLLEHTSTQIAKVVLVASFVTPKFKHRSLPFEKTLSWDFDFAAIKKHAKEIIILSDLTDHIVPEAAGVELKDKLVGQLVTFNAELPHVKGEKEPQVLAVL